MSNKFYYNSATKTINFNRDDTPVLHLDYDIEQTVLASAIADIVWASDAFNLLRLLIDENDIDEIINIKNDAAKLLLKRVIAEADIIESKIGVLS